MEGAERQRLRRWEMGTTDPGFKVGWAGRGGTVGAVGSGRKHGGSRGGGGRGSGFKDLEFRAMSRARVGA